MIFRFPVLSPSDSQHDLSVRFTNLKILRLQFAAAAVGFGKGGVNRPGTGSFCTRQQEKKGSKHGPASTPAQPRPKRKAAPATLVDKHADEDGLVEQLAIAIDEAETRVAIKVLFVQQHKEPDESQWHGSDGCVPQIAEAVGCHPNTPTRSSAR